jgi:hypothetical protein
MTPLGRIPLDVLDAILHTFVRSELLASSAAPLSLSRLASPRCGLTPPAGARPCAPSRSPRLAVAVGGHHPTTQHRRISASRALDAGRALAALSIGTRIHSGSRGADPTRQRRPRLPRRHSSLTDRPGPESVDHGEPLAFVASMELCVLCMFLVRYALKWVVMHLMTPPYLVHAHLLTPISLTSNTPPSLPQRLAWDSVPSGSPHNRDLSLAGDLGTLRVRHCGLREWKGLARPSGAMCACSRRVRAYVLQFQLDAAPDRGPPPADPSRLRRRRASRVMVIDVT